MGNCAASLRTIAPMPAQKMTVGQTIKALRDKHAIDLGIGVFSQGKLAAALDVDRNTVAAWENTSSVPANQRLRLAKFFNVDPSVLGVEGLVDFRGAEPPEWFVQYVEQQSEFQADVISRLDLLLGETGQ